MLKPFASSGVFGGMSMPHRETVRRQPPWFSPRSTREVAAKAVLIALGLWATRAGVLAAEVPPVSPSAPAGSSASRPADSKAVTPPDAAAKKPADAKTPDSKPADPQSSVPAVSQSSVPADEAQATPEPAGPTHRYARIPKRNAFGIKPPQAPAPPEPEKEPPKDRPEFFLTGFTTVRGEKRAFVAYQPKGKPIQYPRALIPDGEVDIGDGVLKLVSIDPVEKSVLIAYNGEEIPLNFKDNAVKVTPSGAAPGGAPGVPGAPGLPPSALRGNQPPPPIINQPGAGSVGAAGGAGFFPGSTQPGVVGAAPTVIGRGGAVLSGGSGLNTLQASPITANSIQAGGTPVHGGIDVPAVAPAADQLGGTVPANPARIGRSLPPPPPAPFPGLPGQ